MSMCTTENSWFHVSAIFINKVLKSKSSSPNLRSIAKILRLIITNQWRRLDCAFKKYKIDINIYLKPILDENKEFIYYAFSKYTFLQIAVQSFCTMKTIKTLLQLGSDCTMPDYYLFYKKEFVSNNITTIDIQNKYYYQYNEAVEIAILNKNWLLVDLFYKQNKYCLFDIIWLIKDELGRHLKKYQKKYPHFFIKIDKQLFFESIEKN